MNLANNKLTSASPNFRTHTCVAQNESGHLRLLKERKQMDPRKNNKDLVQSSFHPFVIHKNY